MKNSIHILAACSAYKPEPGSPSVASGGGWFQTFPPYGRYPVGGTIPKADKDAVYVYDADAAQKIVESFRSAAKRPDFPGVLVDREHDSLDPKKPSDAMAWAKDIRQEEDGSIWTKWEFTPKGKELWETKTLINRSPAFYSDKVNAKEYHPCELVSIGMTNTPHFEKLSTLAAARAAEVSTQERKDKMNEIMKALGLAEGASEADAVAAINALKTKASDAVTAAAASQTKADEAEAKCRKMECDAFLEKHKDKIADVAACREVYMKDPECAKKMLGACKAAETKTQTVLGAAKKTPTVETTKELGTCREQMAALPPSERPAFYQSHKAEIDGE